MCAYVCAWVLVYVCLRARVCVCVRVYVYVIFSEGAAVDCRNRGYLGSNPPSYHFEVWAFSVSPRHASSLSCINGYLAIDCGGNVNE